MNSCRAQDSVTEIQRLLSVSRGDAPADLILKNARLVNVFTRTVERTSVAIAGGRIAGIGDYTDAKEITDLDGAYLAPGFIDAHMHVESTMMMPSAFARAASPHGTTGVVLDPHEIANVLGVAGIKLLMDACDGLRMSCFFALPSCVPSSPLETSGAVIEAADLEPLFADPRVVALAEVMNFPGVIAGDSALLAKLQLGLHRGRVDGHCPGTTGHDLQAYVAAGISSEHECTTAEQALERVKAGMQVFVREGSAARNIAAVVPAITSDNAHRFCFCTDDRHPKDLVQIGHIDHCVRTSITAGLDPMIAIAMATIHSADHYGLRCHGAIAPGRYADMIVFDDLQSPSPRKVFHHGVLVAHNTRHRVRVNAVDLAIPPAALNTVHLPGGFDDSSLEIPVSSQPMIRVIEMDPHQIVTGESRCLPAIYRGRCVSDPERDILKIAVIERHRMTGNIGLGFVHGFGLQRGAIASTVGHDAHNLIVVGTNDQDMVVAAQSLAKIGGGQCVVEKGKLLAVLELPIAGVISPLESPELIKRQQTLLIAAAQLGCPIHDPFMPLSFLALPVIPKLKITDLGLVDVERFQVVSIFV